MVQFLVKPVPYCYHSICISSSTDLLYNHRPKVSLWLLCRSLLIVIALLPMVILLLCYGGCGTTPIARQLWCLSLRQLVWPTSVCVSQLAEARCPRKELSPGQLQLGHEFGEEAFRIVFQMG